MNEPAHSPLGPSSSDRWIACPGSVLATQHLPDEDTEFSILGTAAHSLAESCRAKRRYASEYLHNKIEVPLVTGEVALISVDQQMVDGVQAFMDYVDSLPGDDYNEERVYYTEYVPDGFGTMDCAKTTWNECWIVDFKYGEGVKVFAEENSQLMLYALGFYLKYGWLYDIKSFNLHIFQPRLDHIDKWAIDVPGLLKWADVTAGYQALRALRPGAPFAAGDWCQFCKLRRKCEVRGKALTTVIAGELEELDQQLAAPLPGAKTLTNTQVSKVLALKSQITKWLSDVEDHAMQELQNGREVGGWKVVEGRSNRTWGAAEAVVSEAFEEKGLDVWGPPKMITPPQAEEKFGKALFAPATEKKAAGPLAHLITKSRGSPVLAPESDKRQSILANPDTEMEELE